MDIFTLILIGALIIFGAPVAILFELIVIGTMLGLGAGIIGKVFDFFTDAIAGKESTDFGDEDTK